MGIIANTYGQNLRKKRESSGLTQEELAKKAAISPGQIVRYESGKNIPREEAQLALAKALGADPLEFYFSENIGELAGGLGLTRKAAKTIGRRIKTFRDGSSVKSLCVLAGMEPKEWQAFEEGDSAIDYDKAARIAEALGRSVIEVLGDEGRQMLKPRLEDYTYIAHYPAEVSAGGGAENDNIGPPSYLAFLTWWLKQRGLHKKDLFAVTVRGDSMEPELSDGDVVVVDRSHRDISEDALYVVRLASWEYVKRLQRQPDGKISVLSSNLRYAPMVVGADTPDEEFKVIGKVVWMAREV